MTSYPLMEVVRCTVAISKKQMVLEKKNIQSISFQMVLNVNFEMELIKLRIIVQKINFKKESIKSVQM